MTNERQQGYLVENTLLIIVELLLLTATLFSILGLAAGSVRLSNTLLPTNVFDYEGWLCYVFGTMGVVGFLFGIFAAIRGIFTTDVKSYEVSAKGASRTSDGCMAQLMGVFLTPVLFGFMAYALAYYLFWVILEAGAYLLPYIIGGLLAVGSVVYAVKMWRRRKTMQIKKQVIISLIILLLYGGMAFFFTNGISLNEGMQQITDVVNPVWKNVLKENSPSAKKADSKMFDDFLKRFTSDMEFQYAHVKFPIGNLEFLDPEADPQGVIETKRTPFTKELWILRSKESFDSMNESTIKAGFKRINDKKVVWSLMYSEIGSGSYSECFTFEYMDGSWYVTQGDYDFGTDLPTYEEQVEAVISMNESMTVKK
ncbi:hypothetical protein [Parabacteroides hominis]|uniref:Uncharacterized protein n=1 Tax=Parabacteroides hominis TaxID=2763057 RepID=A0ABR7DQI2_9BACT|nr:hypothetical protein [Parabacteroides hominis]MBC5633651.1 hypothetical protein [Parabacteroides hominis]